MTQFSSLPLLARAAQRVSRGYPWVFRSDLAPDANLKDLTPGQLVHFTNPAGAIIATGYAHPKLQLLGRVLAKGQTRIDHAFFVERFRAAMQWRDMLFPGAPYYRLVHAESDGLGGLIIDRYGDTLSVQSNSAGMDALETLWLPALQEVTNAATIVLKYDSAARAIEGLGEEVRIVRGNLPEDGRVKLIENNVSFVADLLHGQKTGWFFDQRPHRAWVADKAKDKKLIDVFSHTGGFGITALARGAAHVTCVDSAAAALDVAKENARLNKVEDRFTALCGKAFDVLETLAPHSFDIVCVDPPAFVKVKKDMAVGLKGYEKLARLAAPLVVPGGLLFYASCSSHPTEQELLQAIYTGIGKAGRSAALVYNGMAGPDHPVHSLLPETRYLKALAFRLE